MTDTIQLCIPYVAGIIERQHEGELQLLIQTRWKPSRDPLYSGTFEFVAGVMDKPFENVYEALARELQEEVGLKLKRIINDSQTITYSPKGMTHHLRLNLFVVRNSSNQENRG